jgi:hypothetical protein
LRDAFFKALPEHESFTFAEQCSWGIPTGPPPAHGSTPAIINVVSVTFKGIAKPLVLQLNCYDKRWNPSQLSDCFWSSHMAATYTVDATGGANPPFRRTVSPRTLAHAQRGVFTVPPEHVVQILATSLQPLLAPGSLTRVETARSCAALVAEFFGVALLLILRDPSVAGLDTKYCDLVKHDGHLRSLQQAKRTAQRAELLAVSPLLASYSRGGGADKLRNKLVTSFRRLLPRYARDAHEGAIVTDFYQSLLATAAWLRLRKDARDVPVALGPTNSALANAFAFAASAFRTAQRCAVSARALKTAHYEPDAIFFPTRRPDAPDAAHVVEDRDALAGISYGSHQQRKERAWRARACEAAAAVAVRDFEGATLYRMPHGRSSIFYAYLNASNFPLLTAADVLRRLAPFLRARALAAPSPACAAALRTLARGDTPHLGSDALSITAAEDEFCAAVADAGFPRPVLVARLRALPHALRDAVTHKRVDVGPLRVVLNALSDCPTGDIQPVGIVSIGGGRVRPASRAPRHAEPLNPPRH